MRKREGFTNQILIHIPNYIIDSSSELTQEFYIKDIGYFPRAEEHFVNRTNGTSSFILILCTDGEGWCSVDKCRYELGKDEAIIIDRESSHSYGSSDKGWWQIFWIHFNGSNAEKIATSLSGNSLNRKFSQKMGFKSRQFDTG